MSVLLTSALLLARVHRVCEDKYDRIAIRRTAVLIDSASCDLELSREFGAHTLAAACVYIAVAHRHRVKRPRDLTNTNDTSTAPPPRVTHAQLIPGSTIALHLCLYRLKIIHDIHVRRSSFFVFE